ncbi:MAG: ion transporter [Bryobacteraceae bacterium]|nr:ion transporter [Bryobacteraceae bacterium]
MTVKPVEEQVKHQRWELLHRLEAVLEAPLLLLGLAWLCLLVAEFVWGLSPILEIIGTVIWIIFILDFLLRVFLAPSKLTYLKSNWLTLISLLVPAARIFRVVRLLRVLRLARAARGLRLLRVITGLNRGMHALGTTMGRRGFGYVTLLTFLVTFVGAAGMYAFENENADGRGLHSYAEALWWTAMLISTMGSEYWPQTSEGRMLCFLLSLYAFAVFGYVTATIATFFIGRDAENSDAELAGARSIEGLRLEIAALRAEIQTRLKPDQPTR